MLIESLEKKTKLAMFTVLLAVSASAVTCGLCFWFSLKLVRDQQQQVYILDGSIPFMAERSKNEMTFDIEAKAHIQLFHQYFFNLSPRTQNNPHGLLITNWRTLENKDLKSY